MKRILAAFSMLVLALAAWTGRVVWGGEQELERCDEALSAGDADEAIAHARRAASFFAPGAPHVAFAYRRMIALAVAAEERHHRDTALAAWRAVRQASLDTRWIVAPHQSERERADRELARLLALGVHERAGPDKTIEAEQFKLLRTVERPKTPWVGSLILGLLVASGGFAWASSRAAAAGKVDWAKATRPLLVAALGVALWILGWWGA